MRKTLFALIALVGFAWTAPAFADIAPPTPIETKPKKKSKKKAEKKDKAEESPKKKEPAAAK